MKYLIFCLLSSVAIVGASGAQVVDEEARYRKTGGTILMPGKGEVRIINAQSRVAKEKILSKSSLVKESIHIPAVVENGEFSFDAAARVTGPTVYVVDNPSYPMSLFASEAGWGLANVANLTDEQALKVLLRVIWVTCGATTPRSPGNPLGAVKSPDDLNRFNADVPEMDELVNVMARIQALGLTPDKRITYKKACRLGIAPAPTNEVQRAILESVRAEQSAAPTNPIRIEFDPKTGR